MIPAAPPVGLYVHVPFCVALCPYCDFVVYAGASARGPRSRIPAFLAALEVELRLRAEACAEVFGPPGDGGRPRLRSLYLGGGTPSMLPAGRVASLVDAVRDRFGRLDMLVNCAATTEVIPHADLEAASTEVWRRILDVNLLGTWTVISTALPLLRADGGGQVINITSASASRPAGSSIPYAVSKAALNHMTLLLAKALGPDIRVNAVAPGMVDTPWTADWDEAREQVRATVALRREGRPEDVAEVCLGIARSSYVTGAVVPVDGGLSLL